MSRLKRKIRFASLRGAHLIHRRSLYPDFYKNGETRFDVYFESEGVFGPRGLSLTKRQAALLAYSNAVSKKQRLTISYGN